MEQNLNEVLQVRRDKLKALVDAGQNPFEITKYDVTAHAKEVTENYDAFEEKAVSMAGRIMFKRGQGKVGFYGLQDATGMIQLFLK